MEMKINPAVEQLAETELIWSVMHTHFVKQHASDLRGKRIKSNVNESSENSASTHHPPAVIPLTNKHNDFKLVSSLIYHFHVDSSHILLL